MLHKTDLPIEYDSCLFSTDACWLHSQWRDGRLCVANVQMHHAQFDVRAALTELYNLSLKYYDDVSDDLLWQFVSARFFSLISNFLA